MREIVFMIRYAPITLVIVVICTIVYGIAFYMQKLEGKSETAYLLGAIERNAIHTKHQYWRLVTANFVHVDFLHYLFNMMFLIDLGSTLESHISCYVILMVLSGLFSTGLTYLYDQKKKRNHLTFGASGFGFGILGFFAGLLLFTNTIDVNYMRPFISMIVLNLIYTFSQPHISKTGHLGGFVAGLLVSILW